jgi:MFS family permease
MTGAAAGRPPVVDDGVGGIFSTRFAPTTVAVLTTIALAAFDALAVIAALPEIGADLGQVWLLPWVINGFLVASTIAVVVAGPVIDAFGVRATFRVTLVGFVAASVACALAPSMPLLVAARVVQGLGGGLVVAVCYASVGVAYPGRLVAKAFAAESAVWGIAGFGGPAVASVLVATLGWPSVFLLNLPLGLAAAVVGWRAFPERVEGAHPLHFDLRGVLVLASFVVVVLLGVGQVGVWSLPALGAAGLLGWAYWRHSTRHPDPVLAPEHLIGPRYRRDHLIAFLVLAAGLAADSYLPLYLRAARGSSTAFAAFSVLWLTVGWTGGSFLTSWLIDRHGARRLVLGAFAVQGIGLAGCFALVLAEGSIPLLFAGFFLVGLGVGVGSTTALIRVQRRTDAAEMGRANAAHQFARNLGITFGVAVGGAALLFVVGTRVDDLDAVRDLLAESTEGVDDAPDRTTGDAVAAGFAATLGVATAALAVGAVALAGRTGEPAADPG